MSDPAPPTAAPVQAAELSALLGRLGAVLLSTETIGTTIEMVTLLARETIPGTTGAGLTLVDVRGKRSIAASSPLVESADALQYQLDSGPCLTAWRDQVTVRIDDMATETRWPQWTTQVGELKVHSMISAPLVAGDTAIGAMKVYSDHPGVYDLQAERVLELFARQAAVLLANTQTLADAQRTNEQLTAALQTRDVIGQAKGILLARGAADDTMAFAMLVEASQRANLKLNEVARQLVTSVMAGNGDPVPGER